MVVTERRLREKKGLDNYRRMMRLIEVRGRREESWLLQDR
jgi:hypothetical protein